MCVEVGWYVCVLSGDLKSLCSVLISSGVYVGNFTLLFI